LPLSPAALLAATATSVLYTLYLHDALPIYVFPVRLAIPRIWAKSKRSMAFPHSADEVQALVSPPCLTDLRLVRELAPRRQNAETDRKSTRLNSSHVKISYAVFCLKKKTVSV